MSETGQEQQQVTYSREQLTKSDNDSVHWPAPCGSLQQDLELGHGLVVNVRFLVITVTAVLVRGIIMPVSRKRVGGYRINIWQVKANPKGA